MTPNDIAISIAGFKPMSDGDIKASIQFTYDGLGRPYDQINWD